MGTHNYYKMLCFNRKFKIAESEPPPDVREAFWRYTHGSDRMSPDHLLHFILDHQRDQTCTAADVHAIMQTVFRHHPTARRRRHFSLDDFFYYLFRDDLNGPINTQVHHDMTAPLQHYFIYTGHNSYLTGNQLSSDCSEVPIVKSLENGVRGIELDLWPNSAKDKVHVLHGRTLTTPVSLMKCLKSIKEHAFVTSPYPVIITLEDHLTPELQAKVAEMLTDVFGNMLYCPGSLEEFPSPKDLQHKIILSTKPPKEYLGADINKDEPEIEGKYDDMIKCENPSDSDDEDAGNSNEKPGAAPQYKRLVAINAERMCSRSLEEFSSPKVSPKSPKEYLETDTNKGIQPSSPREKDSSDDEPETQSDSDDEDNDSLNKRSDGAPQYKHLIAIHDGDARKKRLKQVLNLLGRSAVQLSLSEQELEKAASLHASDVVRFTQKNILRVFPKGTRVTSSNFRPVNGWIHGAQMVALNMQGYGKSLMLMQGLFRSNGGCGYFKKPDVLMVKGRSSEGFDPKLPWPVRKTLKVIVYMGDGWRMDFSHRHFDTFSPPDFYTKIYIHGVPSDDAKVKTKVKEDEWAPYWDQEFTFPLRVPELALLRIEVREYDRSDKDDFAGQTCLPVSELRSGIRAVPLYDKKGNMFKSVRLLMRFQLE